MNDGQYPRELLPIPSAGAQRELIPYQNIPNPYGVAQPNTGESDLSLGDLFAVFKKRGLLVAGAAVAGLILSAIYCFVTEPLYSSTTTLEMRGYAPAFAGIQQETLYGNDTRRIEFQKTTVAKLALDGVADAVLAKDDLAEEITDYFRTRRTTTDKVISHLVGLFKTSPPQSVKNDKDGHFLHKPTLIQKYLSLIDITPIHETNLMEVKVTSADAGLSQRIANMHAQGFIDHLTRERQSSINANLQLLERQADEVKSRVGAADKALAQYAKDNRLISLSEDKENNVVLRQMEQLGQLVADASAKRIKSESLLKELDSKDVDDTLALDDESVRTLRTELKQATVEYMSMGEKATEAYPAMREIKARINALKSAITSERKRLRSTLESQFRSDLDTEQKLRDQIEAEKDKGQETARKLIDYTILLKESTSLRDLYQAVLKQVAETKISAASVSSNVFVTDYASFPTSPSAPRTKLIVTLCTILGLIVGLAIAVVLEFLDNTLKSEQDTYRVLDLPLLGSVPSFSAAPQAPAAILGKFKSLPWVKDYMNSGTNAPAPIVPPNVPGADAAMIRDSKLITVSAPQDFVSEALRTIRAGILLSSADRPPKVILMTSAKKGEGKTTIVANLAVTLAQAYHKTIVIDADMRQSSLSRLFVDTGSSGPGLSELLAGQARLGDVVSATSVPALDILPAGSPAPNPAELLSSQTMRNLILELSTRYELILIDSPPVLPVADALMLSRLVDSVVLVTRSNYTERHAAVEARRRLLRVNARILGVVLNDVHHKTSDGYAMVYDAYIPREASNG